MVRGVDGDSWEARMAQRAAERRALERVVEEAEEIAAYAARHDGQPVRHYEGTCDVCGAARAVSIPVAFCIDVGVEDDGRVYTWVRHLDGPDANCARYSSRVWLIQDEPPFDQVRLTPGSTFEDD